MGKADLRYLIDGSGDGQYMSDNVGLSLQNLSRSRLPCKYVVKVP